MSCKLVFSDIDGTLLTSHHRISPGTRESVQALRQAHIPFVLVSARMPAGIIPLQKELGIDEPVICFSGALVLGAADADGGREVLLNKTMDHQDVRGIYSIVSAGFPLIAFSAYNQEHWLAAFPANEWVVQEKEIAGTSAEPFDFDGAALPQIHKILCMGPPEEIDSLELELKRRHPEITVYKSKPTYLEIMAQAVSKSAAIAALLERYQVAREDIIALGDNYNDMDMLRFAGLGVAMGNSPDEVKAAADKITLSNDEEGVKAALERYCLNGRFE